MTVRPCLHLLTKTDFTLHDPADHPRGGSVTRAYWCAITLQVCGPDSGPVDADDCTPDRECYERGPLRKQEAVE